jgi:energy-coupling factor transport system permease protein
MIATAVYSACIDPDRVLRRLRPLAGRSALTATLISRLVPVAARDATRLREAARLRGPAAAPVRRGAFVRRLLAGSLDRSVDVAATLELRGYGLLASGSGREGERSRHDRRLWLAAAALAAGTTAARAAGAGGFGAYPRIEIATDSLTLLIALAIVLAGLVPLRRRRARRAAIAPVEAARA